MLNSTFKATAAYPDLNRQLDERYQVVKILAARPWGRTYLAQDLRRPSQPECVIHHLKVIPEIPDYAEAVRNLFDREVAILDQLGNHPQIPQFLACFEDEYGFYVVQEFIPGSPLLIEFQPGKAWQPEQVIQLLQDVLEPLACVHYHGSIHGNLKPTNVLRHRLNKRLYLVDFGAMPLIQKTLITAHGLPLPEVSPACLGYQPLEQLQGLACPGSDVYALGLIAIQALTGVTPTQLGFNPNTAEILWKVHCASDPSSHRGLMDVLDGMVQWDLSRRFVTAEDVLNALEAMHQAELGTVRLAQSAVPVSAMEITTTAIAVDSSPVHHFNGAEAFSAAIKSAALPEPSTSGSELATTIVDPPLSARPTLSPDQLGSDQLGSDQLGPDQLGSDQLSPDTLISPSHVPVSPQPIPAKLSAIPEEPVPVVFPDPPKPKRSPKVAANLPDQPIVLAEAEAAVLPEQLQQVLEPNPPSLPTSTTIQIKRVLANVFSNPSVRRGAGGTVLATSCAAVGWTLLASTEWSAKGNQIWQRVTKNSDPAFQSTHRSVGDMTDKWRKEWQSGVETFGQAERAMEQGKWGEAKQLAQNMPELTYWKDKGAVLANQATVQAETESRQLVQTAFDRAYDKDFTKALKSLKQVVPGTAIDKLAQEKVKEYTEKQQIKAWSDLQRAYDRAEAGDFPKALVFLWQIPEGTAPYETAQAKIIEYTEKQKLRSQPQIKAANDQGRQNLVAVRSTEGTSNLNPGSYLRETSGLL